MDSVIDRPADKKTFIARFGRNPVRRLREIDLMLSPGQAQRKPHRGERECRQHHRVEKGLRDGFIPRMGKLRKHVFLLHACHGDQRKIFQLLPADKPSAPVRKPFAAFKKHASSAFGERRKKKKQEKKQTEYLV